MKHGPYPYSPKDIKEPWPKEKGSGSGYGHNKKNYDPSEYSGYESNVPMKKYKK